MKIVLNKIWGEGFLSFYDNFEFNLQNYLGKSIQIDGRNEDESLAQSNGSGKSALLETIIWRRRRVRS